MPDTWTIDGARYGRDWGGRRWALDVASAHPGLVARGGAIGPVLALDGLTARGRSGPEALGGASLVDHAARLGRVEAVYAPPDWGSLRVRAAWTPRGREVLDLEVQVQAFTVDELQSVVVHVATRIGPAPADGGPHYLEMIHPDDGRREPDGPDGRVRYALFCYDLERGVVLRGRLRGIWLPSRPDEAEAARLFEEFLREPLPLGS